jgi:hypothetical protein
MWRLSRLGPVSGRDISDTTALCIPSNPVLPLSPDEAMAGIRDTQEPRIQRLGELCARHATTNDRCFNGSIFAPAAHGTLPTDRRHVSPLASAERRAWLRRDAPEPRGSAINTARSSANFRISLEHERSLSQPHPPRPNAASIHHVWHSRRARLRRLVAGQEGSRPRLLP